MNSLQECLVLNTKSVFQYLIDKGHHQFALLLNPTNIGILTDSRKKVQSCFAQGHLKQRNSHSFPPGSAGLKIPQKSYSSQAKGISDLQGNDWGEPQDFRWLWGNSQGDNPRVPGALGQPHSPTHMCRFSMIMLRLSSPTDCILLCLQLRNRHRSSPTYWGPRFCHLNNKTSTEALGFTLTSGRGSQFPHPVESWPKPSQEILQGGIKEVPSLFQLISAPLNQHEQLQLCTAQMCSPNLSSRGSLTLSAWCPCPEPGPSRAGWQCHTGCALHRQVGPATASEPRSSSKRKKKLSVISPQCQPFLKILLLIIKIKIKTRSS